MRRLLLASMLLGCAASGTTGGTDSGAPDDVSTDAALGDTDAADAFGSDADVGPIAPDAAMADGGETSDSGSTEVDSGSTEVDSGSTETDAGWDSGSAEADAGSDAGMPDAGSDAGLSDAGPACTPRTEHCGLPADEDCDGMIDEGCGPCTVGSVACAAGCCPEAETWLTDDGAYPDIDVDARGNVYVLYSVPSSTLWSTRLARYDASTSRWSDSAIGPTEGSARAVLRLDENGGVHILAGRDGRSLRYYYSSSGIGTPTSVLLTTTYDLGGTLDLAVRGGVAHVVYTLSDPSYQDRLIYRTGGFGAGFLLPTNIDAAIESHRHPRVAIDASGRPWLLYEAYSRTAGTTLRVAHHDGSAWSYTDIETAAVGVGREHFNHHMLDVTSLGQVRVLYVRGATPRELYLAERSSGGGWTSRSVAADLTASVDDEEDELVFAADGVITYGYRAGVLASLAAPRNLGRDVALRRVGSELYVAYESSATRGTLMFARLPLP